jgi:BirA family transcriptional regulator, biotin operon repressor / biotin---[acetyl-CoA-carboxylase] ligase
MFSQPDPLPADFAEAFAAARGRFGRFGSPLLFFSTIGSTNDVASALAERDGAEGAVVIADAQTAGRGRRGRSWFSPPGSGLYVSVVLTPGRAAVAPLRATALLTLTAGVALAEAVTAATGLPPDIKWPNDLLVGRRKLAGILAEATPSRGPGADTEPDRLLVVLGFGINVRPSAFPPELAARVTSLETELGRAVDRAALCAESLAALARRYEDLMAGRFDAILEAWRRRAPDSCGARVRWDTASGSATGITAGIDDSGALLVRTGDTVERLVAGEVRWE